MAQIVCRLLRFGTLEGQLFCVDFFLAVEG